MKKSLRKKPNKKYLVIERQLDVEAPDFITMTKEQVLYYLKNFKHENTKSNTEEEFTTPTDFGDHL